MAELADAQDLGSCIEDMQVRSLLPAPDEKTVVEETGDNCFLGFLAGGGCSE
jgi:hypothetical protein